MTEYEERSLKVLEGIFKTLEAIDSKLNDVSYVYDINRKANENYEELENINKKLKEILKNQSRL